MSNHSMSNYCGLRPTTQSDAEAVKYELHVFKAIECGEFSGNEENCPDILYEWRT